MDAISAVTRTLKTMADGSLRVTVEIQPQDAKNAFDMLGSPDTPIAIARLTQEASKQQAQDETIEKAKGGFLSQWLAMRCNEPEFWAFMEARIFTECGMPVYVESLAQCDDEIKSFLEIKSKTEIDNNPKVEKRFHELIRIPYSKWLAGARG